MNTYYTRTYVPTYLLLRSTEGILLLITAPIPTHHIYIHVHVCVYIHTYSYFYI